MHDEALLIESIAPIHFFRPTRVAILVVEGSYSLAARRKFPFESPMSPEGR